MEEPIVVVDVKSIQRNDSLVVSISSWAQSSVLQRRAEQFIQNGYSFQRMGPQEPQKGEGIRKEKQKKVHHISLSHSRKARKGTWKTKTG